MREPILKAVSNPPKILWAPFLPAFINLGIQFPAMFISMAAFGANPVIFMGSIAVGHIIAIVYGAREPHLSAMIMSFGKSAKKTNNLYKDKGNKFAP